MNHSKKMGFFDVVRVHVYDDGDVELQLHVMDDKGCPNSQYPSDLFFGVTEVGKGSLDKELISYGCDPQRAKEAIDEVITNGYNNPVKV